eukprot:CAMPEP_0174877808 /NCGR_PEP_ID=MMETSP1114-20130205/82441_1 /TAXON_ID=312471 /ORGANISM="Neobodo designis, Strain CCAP 1951/1" /LENGTH=1031 /DNA_ID=CAMNT_0016113195 /DNA_START=69 /DNA_END=3164 /DNA_ORIENTATION=+
MGGCAISCMSMVDYAQQSENEMIKAIRELGPQSIEIGTNDGKPESRIRRSPSMQALSQADIFKKFYGGEHGSMAIALEEMCKKLGSARAMSYRPIEKTAKEELTENGKTKMWEYIYLKPTQHLTYQQMWQKMMAFGEGLSETVGLPAGARVGLYEDTRYEWMVSCYGIWSRKMVGVTVYANLGDDALVYAIKEAELPAMMLNGKLVGNLIKLCKKAGIAVPKLIVTDAVPADVDTEGAQIWSFDELCAKHAQARTPELPANPKELALIMYTSGTTGAPKGVMMSHGNIYATVFGLRRRLDQVLGDVNYDASEEEQESYLGVLPLAHILEFAAENILLMRGGRIGYGTPRTLTDTSARPHGDLKEFRPIFFAGVPRIFDTIKKAVEGKLPAKGEFRRRVFDRAYEERKAALAKGFESFDELCAKHAQARTPELPANPKELALIMYTSGTTGDPKGVMMTHGNVYAAVFGLRRRLDDILGLPDYNVKPEDQDTHLAYLPLAHILEFCAENILLMRGATLGYGTPRTLTDTSAKPHGDLKEFRPTFFVGVPRIFDTIKKAVEGKLPAKGEFRRRVFDRAYEERKAALAKGFDTPYWNERVFANPRALLGGRCRLLVSGGAPMSSETYEFLSVVFCCAVSQGYALTETCAGGSIQRFYDLQKENVGGLLSVCEVKLRDVDPWKHTDQPHPRGEVLIRGRAYEERKAALAKGFDTPYWNDRVFANPRELLGGRCRLIVSGGAPMSSDTYEFLSVVFCCAVSQGYGLTETCAATSIQRFYDLQKENVGGLLSVCEVKLRDVDPWKHTDQPHPRGEVLIGLLSVCEVKLRDVDPWKHTDQPHPRGEVLIRGPTVAQGYYKQPEKTKEAFLDDGWFATGDVGMFAADGTLKIIGRTKALAKNSHGEYIAMESLESLLVQNDLAMPNGVCILVDSHEAFICALVLTDEAKAMKFAQANNISGSWPDVLEQKDFRKAAVASLQATAKAAGRKPFEMVKNVAVLSDEWTPENGILTAASKLRRSEVDKKYKDIIAKLFKETL